MGCCGKDLTCRTLGHEAESAEPTACPRCGEVGHPVREATIRALLKPGFAESLSGVERMFCRTLSCEVLYYDLDGHIVEKGAATVRVGPKETEDPVPLCYCFNFSRADIESEVAKTGGSTIPERIAAEVRAARCFCETKNPSGACCLGDVNRAVKNAKVFARIVTRLTTLFGSSEGARAWLNAPHPDLDHQCPIELVKARKAEVVARLLEDAALEHPT